MFRTVRSPEISSVQMDVCYVYIQHESVEWPLEKNTCHKAFWWLSGVQPSCHIIYNTNHLIKRIIAFNAPNQMYNLTPLVECQS